MYRINWKSPYTGATGHGQPIFSTSELAEEMLNAIQRDNKAAGINLLSHWVEFVAETEEKNEDEN